MFTLLISISENNCIFIMCFIHASTSGRWMWSYKTNIRMHIVLQHFFSEFLNEASE